MSYFYSLFRKTANQRPRRLSMTPGAGYAPIPEDPTMERPSAAVLDEPAFGQTEPGRGVRWVHFSLGAAVLLPWNAMITAMPYFLSRLEGSSLKSAFPSYLSTSFTAANFICLAYATYTSSVLHSARWIRLSTAAIVVMFVVLTLSTLVPASAGVYFAFTMIVGVLLSLAGSFLSCAIVAMASIFGPKAMQSVMSGQAAIGVLVSLVQLVSASVGAASGDKEVGGESRSAFVFFGAGVVFLLGCMVSHAWLTSRRAYARALEPWQGGTPIFVDNDDVSAVESIESTASGKHVPRKNIWKVARKNAIYNIAVFYVFIVTLAVFPSITTSVQSVHPPESLPLFHPLIFNALHFLVFNVGDFVGRQLCAHPFFLTWQPKRLLLLSLLRTMFIPLLVVCNVQGIPQAHTTPIIKSDFIFMLVLFLLGTTNGHVSSNIMMAAPSLEHNKTLLKDEIDTAATVASFCLIAGLLVGSVLSFGVRAAL